MTKTKSIAAFLIIFNCLSAHANTNTIKKAAKQKTAKTEAPQKVPTNSLDDWANSFHEKISNSVYQSAFWFDGFFSADENEQKPPKTSVKIRLGWLPKSNSLSEFKTRFRLKLSLPNLKNRADLILSDDSNDNLSELPLDSFDASQTFGQESITAALRYVHKREDDNYTDSRIGISGGDIFYRVRHKRRFSWQKKHGIKIEPSLYYFLKDGLGARLLLEYNYQASKSEQYRVNYYLRASDAFKGQEWKYALYRLKQLGNQRASAFSFVVDGRHGSVDGSLVDQYTVGYRYRFNALKTWLFFEIEPFVEWTKVDNFATTPGVALRVEGYFQRK